MVKNILKILDSNNIDYIERGENVRKGCISVQCFFCGNADPSYHLNINLKSGAYNCWRNKRHSGRRFEKLVMQILDCSFREAESILGKTTVLSDEDWGFKELFKKEEMVKSLEKETKRSLKFLPEFLEIERKGATRIFWDYLNGRGFSHTDISFILVKYNLRCCFDGKWSYRIIFPVYVLGNLVTWVGRSIYSDCELPYMNLSVDESVIPAFQCLFNYDSCLFGGDTLYVNEGVIDQLKIDLFSGNGVKACCLFTNSITEAQVGYLYELSFLFKNVIILLDKDAFVQSDKVISTIKYFSNITFGSMPSGFNDPGSMNKMAVKEFTQ